MEDRFKFRVWCDNKGEWEKNDPFIHYDGTLHCWHSGLKPYSLDTHKIMQCTGQKDQNGVLIFEGDILKSEVGDNHIWFVTFDDGGFELIMAQHKKLTKKFRRSTVMQTGCCADDIALYELVRIGNIHENPELLEGD